MQAPKLVATMMFFSTLSVWAAPQGTTPEASVRFNGTDLFVLRSSVGSISPAERAQVVNQRPAVSPPWSLPWNIQFLRPSARLLMVVL
jgi:hypothetical protein